MNDIYFQCICNLPKSIRDIMDNFESFDDALQEHYLEEIWIDSIKVIEAIKNPSVSSERKTALITISNEINAIDGFVQWFGERFGE